MQQPTLHAEKGASVHIPLHALRHITLVLNKADALRSYMSVVLQFSCTRCIACLEHRESYGCKYLMCIGQDADEIWCPSPVISRKEGKGPPPLPAHKTWMQKVKTLSQSIIYAQDGSLSRYDYIRTQSYRNQNHVKINVEILLTTNGPRISYCWIVWFKHSPEKQNEGASLSEARSVADVLVRWHRSQSLHAHYDSLWAWSPTVISWRDHAGWQAIY